MNLRPFVNDKFLYDDFLEEIDNRIQPWEKQLRQSKDSVDMWRAQGAIMALEKFKQLREEVNGQRNED